MKRNIVIFLIIIILFLLIALIGYGIYYLQTRMAVGGTASTTSGSEMTSVV
jgi:exopolysaccharide biosynthesis protein